MFISVCFCKNLLLFYVIAFIPKCFALAMAAVNDELGTILGNKICKNFTISVPLC